MDGTFGGMRQEKTMKRLGDWYRREGRDWVLMFMVGISLAMLTAGMILIFEYRRFW